MGKITQAWDVRFIDDKVHMHPKRPNKPGVGGRSLVAERGKGKTASL
jgi:hypothetical protein